MLYNKVFITCQNQIKSILTKHDKGNRSSFQKFCRKRLHESIPLTFRVADVFWSPHMQEYSPLSSTFKFLIWSSQEVSFCLISYFSPALRISEPFFHWMSADGFDNLQQSITVSPLFFSWFLSSSLKLAGRAKIKRTMTWLYKIGCWILLGYDGWKMENH